MYWNFIKCHTGNFWNVLECTEISPPHMNGNPVVIWILCFCYAEGGEEIEFANVRKYECLLSTLFCKTYRNFTCPLWLSGVYKVDRMISARGTLPATVKGYAMKRCHPTGRNVVDSKRWCVLATCTKMTTSNRANILPVARRNGNTQSPALSGARIRSRCSL